MSYIATYFHFVFRTYRSKYTIKVVNADELYRYITGIAKNLNCHILRINGMPDHIHVAVRLSAEVSPAQFMREVKSSSSKWIRNNSTLFPNYEGWATGYFCSTFSAPDVQKVINYIANQQLHHAGTTFVDEMKQFFERAGMLDKYDYYFKD